MFFHDNESRDSRVRVPEVLGETSPIRPGAEAVGGDLNATSAEEKLGIPPSPTSDEPVKWPFSSTTFCFRKVTLFAATLRKVSTSSSRSLVPLILQSNADHCQMTSSVPDSPPSHSLSSLCSCLYGSAPSQLSTNHTAPLIPCLSEIQDTAESASSAAPA